MSEYRWTRGARLHGDAQVVGAELSRLAAEGPLTPARVVEAARSRASALHPLIFDGTTPAEALRHYHLTRARHVLLCIKIVEGETETIEVRGFEVVEIGGKRSYATAAAISQDAELSRQVRDRLERELRRLAHQLRQWNEYTAIVAAIEDVLGATEAQVA